MAKHVIVTGGTRGIGRAIVDDLLDGGYTVTVIARDAGDIRDLGSEDELDVLTFDLTDREMIRAFTSGWTRPIYAIINNAGMWGEERLDDPDMAIWDDIMALNVDAVHFLTKGLLPHVEDGGRIVNIASQLGTSGRAAFGAYSASKHAVIGLTRVWALELGPRQITVNAVCPGWVRTESNIVEIRAWAEAERTTFESRMQEIADTTALKRFIEPEEVANLVAFLVSAGGSGVTGSIIDIK